MEFLIVLLFLLLMSSYKLNWVKSTLALDPSQHFTNATQQDKNPLKWDDTNCSFNSSISLVKQSNFFFSLADKLFKNARTATKYSIHTQKMHCHMMNQKKVNNKMVNHFETPLRHSSNWSVLKTKELKNLYIIHTFFVRVLNEHFKLNFFKN